MTHESDDQEELKTTPKERTMLREWLGPAPDPLQPLNHVVGRLIDDIDTLERKLVTANQVATDAQRLHGQLSEMLAKHGGLDALVRDHEEHAACRAVGVHPALTSALDGWRTRAEKAEALIKEARIECPLCRGKGYWSTDVYKNKTCHCRAGEILSQKIHEAISAQLTANVCQMCGEPIVCPRGEWDVFLALHRVTCEPRAVPDAYARGARALEKLDGVPRA